MQVTQCDRCGEIVENPASVEVKDFKGQKIAREYDLCKRCLGELERFLGKGEKK